MTIVLSDITTDVRQLSGLPEGYEPANASVWFWPYTPWHVEDGADDFLVSGRVLKRSLVGGINVTPLPQTPVGTPMWAQLRGVKGYGEPWLFEVPATDANLFDLPHIDPDTLDPLVPPSPAWLSAWQGTQDQLDATDATVALKANTADVYTKAAADAAMGVAIGDALDDYTPGADMGSAERLTSATTTATSYALATTDISGLSVTVIGTGRPVDVEFYCPSVTHSVANTNVSVFIAVNGSGTDAKAQWGGVSAPGTGAGGGPALTIKRRITLTDGVSYTFTVRAFAFGVAGTTTLYAVSAYQAMQLNVTAR